MPPRAARVNKRRLEEESTSTPNETSTSTKGSTTQKGRVTDDAAATGATRTSKRLKSSVDQATAEVDEEKTNSSSRQTRSATVQSTSIKKRGKQITKDTGMEEEEDVRMSDGEPTTEIPSAIPANRPFVPHGLLKLPQSIASSLASDFLKKKEIRDLGMACRWMLVSLNECSVNESVPLRVAVRRLKRQDIADGSQKVCERTAALRQHLARIPNLYIGKFRNVSFLVDAFTQTELNYVLEFHRLVDVHQLTFGHADYTRRASKKRACPSPLILPPNLKTLTIEGQKFLPPLTEFVLPETLTTIACPQEATMLKQNFVKVKWPPKLQNLLLTFKNSGHDRLVPAPHLNLPNSITNLEITKFEDVNGRYRDLIFPSLLKRLVMSCEIGKGDFNLLEWHGLPPSCTNFELTLVVDQTVRSPLAATPIIVSGFIKHARIFRDLLAIPIDLSTASSLVSFVTNSLEKVTWPNMACDESNQADGAAVSAVALGGSKAAGLTHLKLVDCVGWRVLPSLKAIPLSITHLDLREVHHGWSGLFHRSKRFWDDTFSKTTSPLTHLTFPTIHLTYLDVCDPPSTIIWMMRDWSEALPESCVLEGEICTNDTPDPYRTVPPETHSQLIRYVNGLVVDQRYIYLDERGRERIQAEANTRRIFDPTPVLNRE